MALSQEDLALIANLIERAISGPAPEAAEPVVTPEPEPAVEIDPSAPDPNGPFAVGINGVGELYRWMWWFNDFSAARGNRFTRSDVYDMMAKFISISIDNKEEWTVGSVPSWRFTKEAFQTRSSEIFGDKMTTEVPALIGMEHGITEALVNKLDLVLRRLVSMFETQAADRDKGPNGEILTTGECVRIGYVFLDAITDFHLVPHDKSSNFMKVRLELHDQYNKMGEGRFGPFTQPGSPVAWSWGQK